MTLRQYEVNWFHFSINPAVIAANPRSTKIHQLRAMRHVNDVTNNHKLSGHLSTFDTTHLFRWLCAYDQIILKRLRMGYAPCSAEWMCGYFLPDSIGVITFITYLSINAINQYGMYRWLSARL